MIVEEFTLKELKDLLYEIIDSYISILSEDCVGTFIAVKKCIRRFREAYFNGYKLTGSYARVRIKGLLMVGFICSSETHFQFSEAVWGWLHYYRLTHQHEYFEDHPAEIKDFSSLEKKCIDEVEQTIFAKPIESCNDQKKLIQAFDMMVHMAHLGPLDRNNFGLSFDLGTSYLKANWFEVNPWRLPRGKSMLIDYWYNVPIKMRPLGHMVLNRLASSEIKSIEDLMKLRMETEKWEIEDEHK